MIEGEDRLLSVLADVLGVLPDQLVEQASPDTIPAWDSLNHLNIITALEGEFGVTLPAADVLEMRSVGMIRSKLKSQGVNV